MEGDPFAGLNITCGDFLEEVGDRSFCSKCKKSRKYYCYSCFVPLEGLQGRIPHVQLPIDIDVIKHPNELDGKSTAVHAAILAPEHVRIYTYPVIPEYPDPNKVLLVYPGENAVTLEDIKEEIYAETRSAASERKKTETETVSFADSKKRCISDDNCDNIDSKRLKSDMTLTLPYNKVVFIDSTWKQTRKIYMDERLKGLRQVKIAGRKTQFWRHQLDRPESFLSTIEAMYYFCCDFHDCYLTMPYTGQYDDLLFFFLFMYKKIKTVPRNQHRNNKKDPINEHRNYKSTCS